MLLQSYAKGAWYQAPDRGVPLADATSGEEVARVSATGLDLPGMVAHARSVGGPALRALTFTERAGLLKALGTFLADRKAELYPLSIHTGATQSDATLDIDGGIATLFTY
ncbi:MAG TPA: phenylacetic acid degradation bifunctional protein PaaZ, partial [Acidimicrobiales bacterium]|nr:phenylacetic acid degradation bifunctional protein PaaZ [Acidimicrobiales bacterium]